MNCCDANGDCQQGDNCPVRKQMTEERMAELEKRYVSWVSDPGLGMLICMGSAAGVISLVAFLFYRFAH